MTELIGTCAAVTAVRDQVLRLLRHQSGLRRPIPVLILGETGTGKSVLARAMHTASPRGGHPFVAVNCAAIPETLVEAELFGVERGAFTDAGRARIGLFQAADGGTLFLDEVGALPLATQAKLLVAVEDRRVRRLGSIRDDTVDAWIVAATSEDLAAAVRERRYRDDLYQRLAAMPITLPPLRERGHDILALADHFLARACEEYGLAPKRLNPDARAALVAYPWPGNVRELANLVERAALLTDDPAITAGALALPTRSALAGASIAGRSTLHRDVVGDFERSQINAALEATGWNLARAAAHLGIPRNTLRYRIEKHGVKRPEATPARIADAGGEPERRAPEGRPVAESETVSPTARTERRLVTFLMVDVSVDGDDDGGMSPASGALSVAAEKVRVFAGRVEHLSTTRLVGAFGLAPPEDASTRAVYAACAIRRAMERSRQRGGGLLSRLALHVADCLVAGSHDGSRVIDAADARRAHDMVSDLVERAEAHAILASSAVTPLIERRFSVAPTAQRDSLRGHVAIVIGPEPTGLGLGGRTLSRFVGRERELATLIAAFTQVEAGQGQVVGIMGEAGVGKSRLLYELRSNVLQLGARYAEGRCFAHGSVVPYAPIIDLIRHVCDIQDDDDSSDVVDKLRSTLTSAGVDAEDHLAFVMEFLGVRSDTDQLAGLSPEVVQARALAAVRELCLKAGGPHPLFIAVEDLHWIDPSSQAFLSTVIDRVAAARILLVTTYRPGYEAPWVGRSYAAQLALAPLSAESSLEVIRSVLGIKQLPDYVPALILPRAGGNPFFIEELAWSLKAQPAPPAAISLPGSVHEVLLARIDRLPEDLRELLRVASVLGRDVSVLLLQHVHGDAHSIEAQLAHLVRREFLTDRERGYRFKHALTQEVAYASLPAARRRELHTAAAEALEKLHAGHIEEVEGELARHYAEADDNARASEYLIRLAVKAERRSAYMEAISAVRRARGFTERLSPGEERDRRLLELVLREVHLLHFSGLVQDALELLLTHRRVVDRLREAAHRGPYCFWLARTYSIIGDRDQMRVSAREAIRLAEECGDHATGGKAHFLLAFQEFGSGGPRKGLDHGRRAEALLTQASDRWWLGMAHWAVGLNLLVLGRFADALGATDILREVGETLDDARLLSYAAWTRGWIHALRGDWAAGVEACEGAFEIARDPVSRAYASGHLGFVLTQAGDTGRAVPILEEAINQFGEFRPGSKLTQARFLAWLGEARLRAGDTLAAEAAAHRAIDYGSAVGHQLAIGIAMRVRGAVRHALGEAERAVGDLLEARALFAETPAPLEHALTDVALAHVLHAAGRSAEAENYLDAARDRFRDLGAAGRLERLERVARPAGL